MTKTLDEINKENNKLAKTIINTTITDWAGNILFESDDYYKALDVFENYTQDDNVFLNSYDDKGVNHGIFY